MALKHLHCNRCNANSNHNEIILRCNDEFRVLYECPHCGSHDIKLIGREHLLQDGITATYIDSHYTGFEIKDSRGDVIKYVKTIEDAEAFQKEYTYNRIARS